MGAWSVTARAWRSQDGLAARPARTRRYSIRWPGSNDRSPSPLRRRSSEAAATAACPTEGVRELERSGRIVVLDDDLAYATPTYDEITATALRLATTAPLTPAALRDATGTSRKYVMAILEDLDRRGILRRTPDGHVPGPRAARSASDRAMTARRVTGRRAGRRPIEPLRTRQAGRTDRWQDPPRQCHRRRHPGRDRDPRRRRPGWGPGPPRRCAAGPRPDRLRGPARRSCGRSSRLPTNRSSSSSAVTCRRLSAPSSTRCWRRSTRPVSRRSSSNTKAEPVRSRSLCVATRPSPPPTSSSLMANGRLRALIETLETTVIPEATWRALDPYGMTVRDIDTPADLD